MKPKAIRGMNDILPEVAGTWRYLETIVREVVESYERRWPGDSPEQPDMDTSSTSTHLGFRERWITTGILGLGLIAFAINGSTTNFVLPKIMTNLRVELYQIHWVITAPGIMRTVIIPTLGWLSGRLGPRTLYLCSIGIFGAGTLGSALAWDWPSLIAFRVLTGVGGGLVAPLSMAIFYHYAEQAPVEAFGLTVARREVQSLLGWMGELATQIPGMALAVVHRRLLAEASTAAWQDYLLYNALMALLAMIPALFVSSHLWRRSRAADAPVEAVETSAPSPTGDAGSRRNV